MRGREGRGSTGQVSRSVPCWLDGAPRKSMTGSIPRRWSDGFPIAVLNKDMFRSAGGPAGQTDVIRLTAVLIGPKLLVFRLVRSTRDLVGLSRRVELSQRGDGNYWTPAAAPDRLSDRPADDC